MNWVGGGGSRYRGFRNSFGQSPFQEYSIRMRHMRFVDCSVAQLLHNSATHVDDSPSLLRTQCRSNVRAKKLTAQRHQNYNQGQRGVRKEAYLKEKCSRKASSDKEKVWGVAHVASGVHIIQPQVKQGKGRLHTLRTRDSDQNGST